jgi:undecaprenyl-diphosphatase
MESTLLQNLLDWIVANPQWTGLFIALVAFVESLAVVGFIMPGAVLLFAIGAIVSTGAYPLMDALLYSIAGAIVGDSLSYWLGRYYKQQLRGIWPLSRYPELIERGQRFFVKHGGMSVFIGRFLGPARAVIPAVAGMMGMPPERFLAINILSSIVWAPAYVLPGVAFGASLGLAAQVAGRLVMLILLLVALLLITLWLVRHSYQFFTPRLHRWLDGLERWARVYPRRERLLAAVIDPDAPELRGLLIWALLLVSMVAVFSLLLMVVQQGAPLRIDHALSVMLQQLRSPWADHVMVMVTQFGGGVVSMALAAGLAVWLIWRRHWLVLAHLVAAILFAQTVPLLLKAMVQLPRPTALQGGMLGYGFPSWHAAMAVVFYGFLAIVIAREVRVTRWLVYGLAAIPVLLISFSQLYLGAHWLSDVVGGLALGGTWVAILGIAYRRHARQPVAWRQLLLVLLLVAGTVWPIHLSQTMTGQLQQFASPVVEIPMTMASWWQDDWQRLPQQRIDSRGAVAQRFNLQWYGNQQQIMGQLALHGWRVPQQAQWGTVLLWLTPEPVLAQLPLLPQMHDGHHESIRLIKTGEDGRVRVLRLWRAPVSFGNGGRGLWFGYLAELELYQPLDFFSVPRTGLVDDDALLSLAGTLSVGDWRQPVLEQGKLVLIRTAEAGDEK